MMRILFLSLLILMSCGIRTYADNSTFAEQLANAEKVREGLKSVRTASDSLTILYDVFDLTPTHSKAEVGWELLGVARRCGNYEAFADMVRNLSVLQLRDGKALEKLLSIVDEIPDESLRNGTELFVSVQKTLNEARYMNTEERMSVLMDYMKEDMTPKHDIYKDILDLYRVVIFIRYTAKGNMYLEYLARLEDMINDCDVEIPYLKNQFYTTAATYYTSSDFQQKAVDCDRKLLEIIKQLEDKYKKDGRKYKNYYRNYYICYRRMLSNYEVLEMDEVKELFSKCAILAEKDEEVRNAFNEDPRPTAYRLLAEKDYTGAIPYLRKVVDAAEDTGLKSRALSHIIEAAGLSGDNAIKIQALEEYNKVYLDTRKQKLEEAVVELQMRYNVNQLKSAMAEVEMQKKNLEISTNQKIISVTLIALFLLAIGLMLLYKSHFKLLSKSRRLEAENKKLRNSLEDFVNNGAPQGSSDLKSFKKN